MTDFKTEIKRINGYLREVTTFLDDSGKPISQMMNPIMTELRPRDVWQIFIGAIIFGAPICYTEEVWTISQELAVEKVHLLNGVGLGVLSIFVFFNFYRFKIKGNVINFIKRCLAISIVTFMTISLFLYLIDKLPYQESWLLTYKRVSLISFPALFSAAISDMLK